MSNVTENEKCHHLGTHPCHWPRPTTFNKKRMTGYIKKSHTGIFTGPMGCGKTHLVINLIENEYKKHFDYIIIICPTMRDNATYLSGNWVKNDDKVWLVEPGDRLYEWIQKQSQLLRHLEVLLIIDDLIADECLHKKRQLLLELAITGRRRDHYLWQLTQSYTAISKNLRRISKAIFAWYQKERADLKTIHEENDVLTDDELVVVRGLLKNSEHACLYICNEFPRGFKLLNHI